MNDAAENTKNKKERGTQKGAGHQVAEWVTLGASALLIIGLAGYLIYDAFQANGPFVPVEIQARVEEVREIEGRFILPIHIANRGGQTLRELKIALHSTTSNTAPSELVIDYLGERSEQVAYLYFDRHPRELKVEPKAVSYLVD